MTCRCGYQSGARCRLFACGSADAIAIQKLHNLLHHLNPDWFYLSGTGLARLCWKWGRSTCVVEPIYLLTSLLYVVWWQWREGVWGLDGSDQPHRGVPLACSPPQLSNFFSFPCFQLFQSLFHAGDVIFPTFSTVFPTLFHFSTFFHCSFLYAGDGTFPPFLRHCSTSSVFQFSSTFHPLFQAGDVTQCGVLLVSPHRPHVLPLFIFSTTLPFFYFFNSLPFSSTPVTLLLHLVPLPFHFLPRFPFFTLLFQVYDVTFPFLRHFFLFSSTFPPFSPLFQVSLPGRWRHRGVLLAPGVSRWRQRQQLPAMFPSKRCVENSPGATPKRGRKLMSGTALLVSCAVQLKRDRTYVRRYYQRCFHRSVSPVTNTPLNLVCLRLHAVATVTVASDRLAACCCHLANIQGGPKKRGHGLLTIILSNVNRFKKITGRFLSKFAVKWILKISTHLAYVAILPRETIMSAKQALNDRLQGSVAAYLRCNGIVNNQIKNGLLLSLCVKKIKSANIWQS